MMHYGIARFVGVSASGHRLRIKKVRKDQALVDFFDPNGTPVRRPYMSGAPSVQMVARYDDYNGLFAGETAPVINFIKSPEENPGGRLTATRRSFGQSEWIHRAAAMLTQQYRCQC
jgi:hypothetical protein